MYHTQIIYWLIGSKKAIEEDKMAFRYQRNIQTNKYLLLQISYSKEICNNSSYDLIMSHCKS